jgi:hypothetical protein
MRAAAMDDDAVSMRTPVCANAGIIKSYIFSEVYAILCISTHALSDQGVVVRVGDRFVIGYDLLQLDWYTDRTFRISLTNQMQFERRETFDWGHG